MGSRMRNLHEGMFTLMGGCSPTVSNRHRSARLRVLLLLWMCTVAIDTAKASPDDLCLATPMDGGWPTRWWNCGQLECTPAAVSDDLKPLQCVVWHRSLRPFVRNRLRLIRRRSMLHLDATHMMAQLLGMNVADAYWLAAFDQALIRERFQLFDGRGRLQPGLNTPQLLESALSPLGPGFYLHRPAPTQRTAILQGLDVYSPSEAPLRHIREWAFGKRETLCRGTLASIPFVGAPGCYEPPKEGDALRYRVVSTESGESSATQMAHVPSGESPLSTHVQGPRARALLRLAVYLHAVADRVEAHRCLDVAPMTRLNDGRYEVVFEDPQCLNAPGQRPASETPQDQEDRLELVLELVYDGIQSWLLEMPAFRTRLPSVLTKDALIEGMVKALSHPSAKTRVKAFQQLSDEFHLCPLPDATAPEACQVSSRP